ncbi:MAG: histidine phosphatase family protein [Chlamydiae bacterium]|nr:histidine phosphatase family protein [Chlamydiota bacterium]
MYKNIYSIPSDVMNILNNHEFGIKPFKIDDKIAKTAQDSYSYKLDTNCYYSKLSSLTGIIGLLTFGGAGYKALTKSPLTATALGITSLVLGMVWVKTRYKEGRLMDQATGYDKNLNRTDETIALNCIGKGADLSRVVYPYVYTSGLFPNWGDKGKPVTVFNYFVQMGYLKIVAYLAMLEKDESKRSQLATEALHDYCRSERMANLLIDLGADLKGGDAFLWSRPLEVVTACLKRGATIDGKKKLAEFVKEWGILSSIEQLPAIQQSEEERKKNCRLIFVHHGEPECRKEELESGEKLLQGWTNTSLSEKGVKQMERLRDDLEKEKIDAAYSSDLSRAMNSLMIITQNRKLPDAIVFSTALKGESHGKFEGLTKKEYQKEAHYEQYRKLQDLETKFFFPYGKDGESIADVMRRLLPEIRQICRKHPGKNVIIMTHGGPLKFFNFLLGEHDDKEIKRVGYGDVIRMEGNKDQLILLPQ